MNKIQNYCSWYKNAIVKDIKEIYVHLLICFIFLYRTNHIIILNKVFKINFIFIIFYNKYL